MKLKSLVLSLTMTVSLSAFAQWFPARVNVQVLPAQVTVQVYNPYYAPIVCSGQVFGQTYGGPLLTSAFYEQFMPAGTNRFAFVYTNAWAPFIQGWANINCRYIY